MPTLLINQGTNSAVFFEDVGGTAFRQSIAVDHGTVTLSNPTGTTVTVDHGTVTLSNPTGTTVQFNNGTVDLLKAGTVTRLEGGTINLVTRVGNVGTVEVGTISAMPQVSVGTIPNTPGGTINLITTVSNITKGSIVVTNGTVAAHAITAATVTEGTLRNLISGTINSATAVINSATISVLPTLPQGSINVTAGTIATLGTMGTLGLLNTVTTVTTVSNLSAGSVNIPAGTITSITNLAAGTITALASGTVTGGTLKDNLAAIGTFTITVAALASSTAGVGRQSTLIDNTTNLYSGAIIAAQITAGSVTAANNIISLYLIRSDNGAPIADDNAGASDAGWTQQNAQLLGNILVPTVGTAIQYKALFDTAGLGHLGPKWGIGVVHNLGNNLHATAGSHSITYTGYNARF